MAWEFLLGVVMEMRWKRERRRGVLMTGLFFPEVHVNQAKLCSIANQLHGTVKAELAQDVVTVVVNGFGTDKKFGYIRVSQRQTKLKP